MLKDAAIAWVRANCTDPKLRADFARKLKDLMLRRVDCSFAVGPALTRGWVPYMIQCFAGELFIFQLSEAQAACLLPAPHALATVTGPRPTPPSQRADLLVLSLSDFELDEPFLTADDRITGSVAYEIAGEAPRAYCLRLDYSIVLAGDETSWDFPEQILGEAGRLRFSFAGLGEFQWPSVREHRGPLALFLRACTLPASGDEAFRRPISNTAGALVDVW